MAQRVSPVNLSTNDNMYKEELVRKRSISSIT